MEIATNMKISPWKLILGGVMVVLTLVSAYLILRPTVGKVATKAVDCLIAGDGQCLYELTPEEERMAYDMTPEQYSRVLNEVILPYLQPINAPTVVEDHSNGMFTASREMITPSGQRSPFYAAATEMNEGIKSP